MRTQFRGRVAVVTGAGSGIGRAVAVDLAERGARLAVSDIDAIGLAATVSELEALGADVHAHVLDVADESAWTPYAATVAQHFGVVHQLYNNAGIARGGTFSAMSGAAFAQVLDVNLGGVVAGTRAFLPHLVASGRGSVVNVSSLNGLLGYSGLSAYCTSKFAVRGFTEALRVDLLVACEPVQVHLVMPGGVSTNISASGRAAGARTPEEEAKARAYEAKYLTMPPAEAARTIVDGVARGRSRILVGRDVKTIDLLVRLLPGAYPRLVARVQRKESSP